LSLDLEETHTLLAPRQFRVRPEEITINIGEGVPIPVPNMPGNWKGIVHDQTVTWLANWVENVNGNYKYVFLAAGSSLKGQSDMQKFEKARELKVRQTADSVVPSIDISAESRGPYSQRLLFRSAEQSHGR
jgi:DNA topoisomerase IB